MKVSIITVCFNAESTIRDTIESVLQQDYNNIEYIIVDGASSDRTLDIINKHKYRGINIIISEPDRGLYDAMNKGIDVSSGDVIAILNSDDVFANKGIISNVVMKIKGFDILYGDVAFYRDGNFNKIFRYHLGIIKRYFTFSMQMPKVFISCMTIKICTPIMNILERS